MQNESSERKKNFNAEHMDNTLYYTALGYDPESVAILGGQELILADIMACLEGCTTIYIPFSCPSLEEECCSRGILIVAEMQYADAVYWGTPTIVDDKVLFPDCISDNDMAVSWNKENERAYSRGLASSAETSKCKRIITGLGTGDVSIAERLSDMGGGRIVVWKNFGEFEDWVLLRILDNGS